MSSEPNAVDRLRAALEASSQGEWRSVKTDHHDWMFDVKSNKSRYNVSENATEEDAAFIVAAHNDLPAVFAEVERLRAALKEIEEAYHDIPVKLVVDMKKMAHRALKGKG